VGEEVGARRRLLGGATPFRVGIHPRHVSVLRRRMDKVLGTTGLGSTKPAGATKGRIVTSIQQLLTVLRYYRVLVCGHTMHV
jgi:hypothetical protein